MDIKARQELNTPAAWDAGEMVFVDGGDGTAAMYVTSASGVPRRVIGGDGNAALYADGVGGALTLYREVPDTLATALARSGTPVSAPTVPDNVLNVSMFFRVLSVTPLTGVQIGGLTLSNGPVQAFITQHAADSARTFQGQLAESGALVVQGGGHHATFAGVTLQPNTLYGLRLGNSQSGVAPQVQLASTATRTGQGWSGLVLDPYLRWYANGGTMGQASYATAAETPAFDVMFEVPAVATPDEPLIGVQAGNGLTGTIDPATKLLTIALPAGQLNGMVLRATGPGPDDVEWNYLTTSGRDTPPANTGSLAVGAPGSLDIGNTHVPAHVLKVTTSHVADVCLYYSAADRATDSGRLTSTPNGVPTVPVIGQWRTSASTLSVAGEMRGVNGGTIYAALVNRSDTARPITLTLTLEDA